MKKSRSLKGDFYLLTVSFIWGMSFVTNKKGLSFLEPFGYTTMCSLMACFTLLAILIISERRTRVKNERQQNHGTENVNKPSKRGRKDLLRGGFCCGVALFGALIFQQMGLVTVDAGKGGFISALYIVIVPILGIFLGQDFNRVFIICLPLALAGLWLLCIGSSFTMEKGDVLIFISTFFYAVHIHVAGHFSKKAGAIKLSLIQFAVVALFCSVGMFLFENISLTAVLSAWAPILYAGIISNGIGFTLQLFALKTVPPTLAGVLLSMEACFAVIGGWIVLQEQMTARELTGCVLMLAAVILVQLPGKEDASGSRGGQEEYE